ncbi:50S ribosomal protein L13 [Pseudothermotoga elfii]|jgi:large subunit ribosomal protein L13
MARPFPIQRTSIVREAGKKWFVVDASGKVLGRLASQIAKYLMGKNEPTFFPGVDNGNYVVVINADKVLLTGKKLDKKMYYHYSGYPGGLKQLTARKLLEKHPERLIYLAVKRMLPKAALGTKYLKRLKVYASDSHPHEAQKPQPLEF